MKTANTLRFGCLLACLVCLTGLSGFARAGVAMSPLKQELSLKPGDQANLKVTLANNSHTEKNTSESVHLEAMDVDVAENGTLTFDPPGSKANSASKWLTLDKPDIEMEPGKSTPVEFTITVPQYAQPGEYYTGLIVTLDRKGKTEKGVVIQYRIASGVFVTVLGRTLPVQAKISRCELLWPTDAPPSTQPATQPTTQPVEPESPKIAVVLQNVGAGRFDGTGTVVILDNKLRPTFRAPLVSKRPCVFANDSRLFEAPITKVLPPGRYLVNVEMDYQSTWAKAHSQLPVEITAAQSQQLFQNSKRQHDNAPFLESNVEKVSQAIYTSATRSIAVGIINTIEGPVHCSASLVPAVPDTDGWLAAATLLEPREFMLGKGARRSIELRMHVPPETKPGIYSASVVVDATMDGTDSRRLVVPLEVEVRSQK